MVEFTVVPLAVVSIQSGCIRFRQMAYLLSNCKRPWLPIINKKSELMLMRRAAASV